MRNFGRSYFFDQLKARVVRRYLNSLSQRLLSQGHVQVATFAFDHIGHQINLRGAYELEELTSVMDWLKRSGLVNGHAVDIGANIGNHSLFFSRYFDRVYSFEPNMKTFRLLDFNASLVGNVECFNVGLSDNAGLATLIVDPVNVGASYIGVADSKSKQEQEIELRTLDSFEAINANRIGLIKIDVEGLELPVLRGATKVIENNRPVILFEQHPSDFHDGTSAVLDYLVSIGYRSFATVMPSPYIPTSVPAIVRNPLTLLLRLAFGLSYKIVCSESVSPGFYAFIVALPEGSTDLDRLNIH